jgi:hypothetical protein
VGHVYRAALFAVLLGGMNALLGCTPPCPEQHLLMLEHARLDSVSAEQLLAFKRIVSDPGERSIAYGEAPVDSQSERQLVLIALYQVVNEADTTNLRHERVELGHITQQADCATIRHDYALMRADHARWAARFDSVQTLLARYPTSGRVQ